VKKAFVFLVLCLIIPSFISAQTSLAPGVESGTKLGNIISTVIGIVLPSVQPIITMLFPGNSKSEATVKISKKELETKLGDIQKQTKDQIIDALKPVNMIASEVVALRQILIPCIEIQDYLREVGVVIAGTPISESNWKRVHDIWPLIRQRVKFVSDERNCDIKPIRSREVKQDLNAIINVGKGTKLERFEIDFVNLPLADINKGDLPTRFRMDISSLLELYQTVQLILAISLQELQDDFAGAYDALSLQEPEKAGRSGKGGKSLNDNLAKDPFQIKIMQELDGVLMQQKITQRLDGVLIKLPDIKK